MSKLEVDKIDPQSGTNLELGTSGDTITIPTGVTLDASNATTTLPSNIVTTDGTQTLTNKSIAATQLSGTITPSDGTVTNAKVNASAAIDYSKLNLTGNIALADLSATGTKDATTFLRGDNTFAEAGGGAFKLLNTQSVTSSVGTVDFVNGTSGVVLDSTYKRYRFIASNMRASTASNFGIRFRQGGSFISSTVYRMRARCFDDNNANHDASNSTGMDYMRLFARAFSNDAVETCMIDFTLNDLSNTSSYTSVFGTGGGNKGNGRAEVEIFSGMITNTTTVDGVQFVLSSGTFESGDFSLYGIEA